MMVAFKKVIFALLAVFLAGCSDRGEALKRWMETNGKKKILSTTAQIGDLVTEIGGEKIDSWVLVRGNLDPHSYELVKGDDEKLLRADLIFYNGLGLEHGASLTARLQESRHAVSVGQKIAQLVPDRILMREGAIDPHLWMDVSLWKKGIAPIVDSLVALDPAAEGYYRERGRLLEQKMDEIHQQIHLSLSSIPFQKRFLVTSHDAFQYFAKSYLAGSTAPEGLAPDGQLSLSDIQRILQFIRQNRVHVLFPESNVSRDSIGKIASAGREMGLDLQICPEPLYGDATDGGSYFDMMKRNGEIIGRYLQ